MAVAVKSTPGARPSDNPTSPAVLSLLGVVYLVACLALVFKIVPDMWWTVWEGIGLGGYAFIGGTFLLAFCCLLAAALLGLGARLLGPEPPEGARAGVFVGFLGLLLVVLLTRWLSVYVEQAAYAGSISPLVGAVITGILGGALLLGLLRLFMSRWGQKLVAQFEAGGWFTTASYKPNQGQRVRRATIFGILVLVGAGIYTLLIHNTLRRGSPDWVINIPFTGSVAIEGIGDAQNLIRDKAPKSAKNAVQIRYPGAKELKLRPGQIVSLDVYKAKFAAALEAAKFGDVTQAKFAPTSTSEEDPVDYLMRANQFIYQEIEDLFEAKDKEGTRLLKEDVVRRLRVLDNETEMADLRRLIEAVKREVELARKRPDAEEDTAFLNLPAGVLLVDRFAMRDVFEEISGHVKIELAGNSTFKEGQIVSKAEFDKAVEELTSDDAKRLGKVPPEGKPLRSPYGPTVYATLTLLPSIPFTVPLLLIAGAIWVAWRAVNMPAFADFLIATEAEMNKVSWTTQKKLVQDTIVVLVTVLVMAVFLFVVDYAWKIILQPLGVLHIPKEDPSKTLKVEQKKW